MIATRFFFPAEFAFGDVIYPPGGSLGPRLQRTIEIVLVYEGSMTAWVDDVPLHATAGTVTLLFPGSMVLFEFAAATETHHGWVHLVPQELPRALDERLRRLAHNIPLSSEMLGLMQQLLHIRNSPLSTAADVMNAIALQMAWRYVGEAEHLLALKQRSEQHSAVPLAQAYIAAHLHEPLSLEQIAQSVSISVGHLIRLFQEEVAQTPMAYVWQQRVRRGVELLEQTGLTVSQIAERCGFATSYHFSRRVKEATGFSPVKIRRNAWKG